MSLETVIAKKPRGVLFFTHQAFYYLRDFLLFNVYLILFIYLLVTFNIRPVETVPFDWLACLQVHLVSLLRTCATQRSNRNARDFYLVFFFSFLIDENT